MLRIRKEQIEVLERDRLARFQVRVLAHVRKIFPDDAQRLGDEEVQRIITEGVKKAATYGVTSERSVTLFIDVMFGVDRDFDQTKSMSWAIDILKDPRLHDSAKMTLIYEQLPQRRPVPAPQSKSTIGEDSG